MARTYVVHTDKKKAELKISDETRSHLSTWLNQEVNNALSSRLSLEAIYQEILRQYEGVPRKPIRNFPIENGPNTEITIGAVCTDSIYAHAMDLKWLQSSPLVLVKPTGNTADDATVARDLQDFACWVALNEADARKADDEVTFDDVQMGTGVYYIPWTNTTKKTKTATVTTQGPRLLSIPPEDLVVPGGSYSEIEDLDFVGIRFWLSKAQIEERGKANNWDTSNINTAGLTEHVRHRRETYSRHSKDVNRASALYDIYDIYCYYDIDGDGYREDLYVVYNHASGRVLHVSYNPFDRRPIVVIRYQNRPHVFWGLGVMEMIQPFQDVVTDLANEATANVMLANERHWVGRDGVVPADLKMRRAKVTLVPNPREDLLAIQVADVYPSIFNLQIQLLSLAEKRVGVNEISSQRSGAITGSRTPGITALSLLQQVNRRFSPAFDAMRLGLAEALKHCLYRYQERLLGGDMQALANIVKAMGAERAQRIYDVLRDKDFDESFKMELTAASPSNSKEADRQNALMLTQALGTYYTNAIQLIMLAANPQTPPPVREVAKQIAEKAGLVIDRTIRTFDTIRDPATFVLDLEGTMEGLDNAPNMMGALASLVGGALGGGAPPGGQSPGGVPPPQGEAVGPGPMVPAPGAGFGSPEEGGMM